MMSNRNSWVSSSSSASSGKSKERGFDYVDHGNCAKRQRKEEGKHQPTRSPPLKKRCIKAAHFDNPASVQEKLDAVRDFMFSLRITNKGVHESKATERAAEKRRERKRQINRQSALRKRIREKDVLGELQKKNEDLLTTNASLKKEQQELGKMIQRAKDALILNNHEHLSVASTVWTKEQARQPTKPMSTSFNSKSNDDREPNILQMESFQKILKALQERQTSLNSTGRDSIFQPPIVQPTQQRYVAALQSPKMLHADKYNNNGGSSSRISQQLQMAIEVAAQKLVREMISSSSERSANQLLFQQAQYNNRGQAAQAAQPLRPNTSRFSSLSDVYRAKYDPLFSTTRSPSSQVARLKNACQLPQRNYDAPQIIAALLANAR